MGWKYLGRIWGVPSLFKKKLGIFLYMENRFLTLFVQCPCVSSNNRMLYMVAWGVCMVGGVNMSAKWSH